MSCVNCMLMTSNYIPYNLSETHVDLLAAIHRLLSWADMWQ